MGELTCWEWDPEVWSEAHGPDLLSFRGLAEELPEEKGG